ncbi:MAG: rmlD substrate binding domain protein [Crocinitomicaceae bacterium]|jgi:GDP-L-fucose synthase|nr:rmlD substrate binding domain protein [Crocinitomicaceae bacterium]
MNKQSRIFIAGHKGMVGSAFYRLLSQKGFEQLLVRDSSELDLLRQQETEDFFKDEKPEYVILAAARVGGIFANNTYRGDFIYENLMIQNNVIQAARLNGVKKLLFLGSSCIYPVDAAQPLDEDSLLTGVLEKTNEPYAIAKIAGIKLCENYYRQYGSNFISVMPTNMFGPNDNYDLRKSHVLPALMRKMHLGKALMNEDWQAISEDLKRSPLENLDSASSADEVKTALAAYGIYTEGDKVRIALWGNGEARREFLHVDDFAAMSLDLFEKVNAQQLYDAWGKTHINIGSGKDLTIRELAALVQEITAFRGELSWDQNGLDGTRQKLLDVSLFQQITPYEPMPLRDAIAKNYIDYLQPA